MPRRQFFVSVLALLVVQVASGALHLTEFMADNAETLVDEDGDTSDWIEVLNAGPGAVDLDGYFLTDDEGDLAKWRFPAQELAPGAFLVVFASGKDRRVAGQELHTNFSLEKDGEFLALVAPDGVTLVTAFGGAADPLPAQLEDISYGLMQTGDRTAVTLLGQGAIGRAHVPTDDSQGPDWMTADFDDTGWASVGTGVGYDNSSTYVPEFGAGGNLGDNLNGVNTGFYLRLPFEVSGVATIAELSLHMKYDDGFVAYLNGTWVEDENAPGAPTWQSQSTGNHSDGEAVTFAPFDISAFIHLLREGTNVLAIHGLNDGIGSSDMLITPELRAVRLTDPTVGGPGFLGTPSPGSINGDTFGGFVGDTAFSVDRGFYDAPIQVEITTPTEGAEIRYTLDGTAPSESRGIIYTGPITIGGTTVLRAMAHKAGFRSTNVDTHTYLFPSDVVNQPRMRTTVTQSARFGPQMIDSLKAVPTISLVTDNTGFMNEGGSNIREEYAASVEMIYPDGREGFQENGGLSNYGGRFTNFRKKSFRMAFRERFGVTKLKYPIFEGFDYSHYPPADEFDAINLRSGSHDMSSRGAYMSNRFTDDSMIEMGNVAPHGRFVHVYLNGEYWGQYHLRERWNADMASSYFGGPKDDYEAVNANDNFVNDEEVYDGAGDFWEETKALVAGADPFNNAAGHIDVANIIDFMLLWVSGDSESEFRAFGSRTQGVPFKFMIKDADGFLRGTSSGKASHAGPLSVMTRMTTGPGGAEFRTLLADRIHKHFFNDGALTAERNIERLRKRVDEARLGFISESARWGDVFREFDSWESYQNNLMSNHFPGLTQTMIGRFQAAGMYPELMAPVFSQHGGSLSPGTPVTMATDADTIYYTLDGSDPREPGGAPRAGALAASFAGTGPLPVTYLSSGALWKYLDDGSDQGTAWREAGFDDSGWQEGPSPLGYGGDGEATTISFGPDDAQKFATTYFRTAVQIPDPEAFLHFTVRLRYDDAAAVYLNGSEIIRTPNLPAGAPSTAYATSTNNSEANWFEYTTPTESFVAGLNTLAAEVHQGSGGSSDIRFDLVVRGETTAGGGANVTDPIALDVPTLLRARSYNSASGEWSALNEAFFTIDTVPADSSNLMVSEFHYHPSEPATAAELAISTDRDDYEFMELRNVGPMTIDLSGVRFDAGINFAFPERTLLASGSDLLLVRDLVAFEARYGELPGVQIFAYTGRLSNDGERLVISSRETGRIHDFTYNDQAPWPVEADGSGASLVLVDPESAPLHAEPANWVASRLPGGSPGGPGPAGLSFAEWAALQGVSPLLDADDDRDGRISFWEFVHGSDPLSPDDPPGMRTSVEIFDIDGQARDYLVLRYELNLDAAASVRAEFSSDLVTWQSGAEVIEPWSTVVHGDGTATVTIRLRAPLGPEEPRGFLRLHAEVP